MPALRFSYGLLALCFTASCFSPDYHCRIICNPPLQSTDCPSGFSCRRTGGPNEGLCAAISMPACPVVDAGAPPDGASPPTDTAEPSDAPALVDAPGADASVPLDTASWSDASPDAEVPEELCILGRCLRLSRNLRDSLVLWLDPTTLPAPGMPVTRWRDRSGHGNDALPFYSNLLPVSRGVGLELAQMGGGGLSVDPQRLDFGTGDFTAIVMARLAALPPTCLLNKTDPSRAGGPLGLRLGWNNSSVLARAILVAELNSTSLEDTRPELGDRTPRLFVVRRAADAAELRVDRMRVAVTTLAPETTLKNSVPLYLGACGTTGWPVPYLHAAILFRGAATDDEVTLLEDLLLSSLRGP